MKIAFAILALYMAIPLLIIGTQKLAQESAAPVARAAAPQTPFTGR
jgi:hypothetical protein